MTLLPHPIVHHPTVFNIGPLQLTGFGLAILMCCLTGQVVGQREVARRGYDPEPLSDMMFAAIVGGLIGAKAYYVIVLRHWDAVFERGGFVFWGGLVGATIAVRLVVWTKRYGMRRIFDVGAPAVAAAYAVGRTGCWAIGDDYGRPWNGFLAVSFPEGAPPSTAGVMAREFGIPIPPGTGPTAVLSVFPTQLYEVAMGFAMFVVLWRMRDHKHAEGWLFGVYLVLAGIERFIVEFFRAKDDRLMGGLTYAQLIALAAVAGGVAWMTVLWKVTERRRGIYAPVSPLESPIAEVS